MDIEHGGADEVSHADKIETSIVRINPSTKISIMTQPIKVGIVGYGFSTQCFHLPFILPNPDFEVYAFLQRAAPPSEDGGKKPRWGHCTVDFPEAKHHRTAESFFADDAIELVIILTHAHEEFVERALLAGKHGNCSSRPRLEQQEI